MENIVNIMGWICLIVGVFFMFTGAVGLLRMPDFYTRLHPAGITDSAGLILVLFGVLLHTEPGLISVKIILLILFSLVTSSTACHALAKAALLSGVEPVGEVEDTPRGNKQKSLDV